MSGEKRDLRNESREWATVGMQRILDLRMNAFGLELFVESYWDTLALLLEHNEASKVTAQLVEPLVLTFRGMTITLDPTKGLVEGGLIEEPEVKVPNPAALEDLTQLVSHATKFSDASSQDLEAILRDILKAMREPIGDEYPGSHGEQPDDRPRQGG